MLAAERCRQLLAGARPALENPQRERWMKLAAREIAGGYVVREGEGWKVNRPAGSEIFTPPPETRPEDEEIFRFREDDEEEE